MGEAQVLVGGGNAPARGWCSSLKQRGRDSSILTIWHRMLLQLLPLMTESPEVTHSVLRRVAEPEISYPVGGAFQG